MCRNSVKRTDVSRDNKRMLPYDKTCLNARTHLRTKDMKLFQTVLFPGQHNKIDYSYHIMFDISYMILLKHVTNLVNIFFVFFLWIN